MANREVIDLDDSDGEDDIQVISERSREGTGASRSSDVRINNVIPVERYLNNNDNDDDVEIVEERINVPEIPSTPSYVIHSPNGPIPVYENREGSGSAGPERRSFQNARGPIPAQSYRNPQEVAGRAEQMRREEQIRAQNIIQARQGRPPPPPVQRPRRAPPAQRRPVRGYPPLPPPRQMRNRRGPGSSFLDMMLQMDNFPLAFNSIFFNEEDDDDDPNFYPGMAFPHHHHHLHDDGGVDQHIMNIIEQRENQEADKKRNINESATKAYHDYCEEKIKSIKAPYTTTLDPEEDYVCILCGVTLGEGLPEEFRGNIKHTKLEKLQEENDVTAPYQALNLITDADRDLAKRIFISTCGHTYCGRCVKNISGVKAILKEKKNKFKKTDKDIDNPFIYAPSKCIAPGCNIGLVAKRRFNEIFV